MKTLLGIFSCVSLVVATASAQDPRSLFVEGYTDQISVVAGESISVRVSTSAATFEVEVAREGKERQVVWTKTGLPGREHLIPADASSRGCNWPETFKLEIPATWKSGYYTIKLRVKDNGGMYTQKNTRTAEGSAFFVVRSSRPGHDTKILLQLSTNTYNAYNNWGGYSLYAYNAKQKVQGRRVSFDRPPASQFPNWEQPFVVWAERSGYTIDYAVNSDLEFHPEILKDYKLVLSVGHDEYWSSPMRDSLEAFIGAGGNVAFLSGNSVCWQVRSEEGGRALVCWKQAFEQDPIYKSSDHKLLSTLWSHHLVDRPENRLTGVGFLAGGYHKSHDQFMDGTGAFTVYQPDHWLFAGTELKSGDLFGAKQTIVGYECDGCDFVMKDGRPVPTYTDDTPRTFEIVATAPAKWHPDDSDWYDRFPKGRMGAAVMGIYTRGGTVVTAGTTDWAHGLRGGEPAVERITKNILDRLGR